MKIPIQELKVDMDDMSIKQSMQDGKVLVIVLDGVKGKASMCEALDHGKTVIETIKGKATRIGFEGSELI